MGCVGGERIRGLGLGFTNPVGTGECWMCVCIWMRWCSWVVGMGLGPGYGAWTRVWKGGVMSV